MNAGRLRRWRLSVNRRARCGCSSVGMWRMRLRWWDMMWVPQLRVAWQRETMEDSPGITAGLASGASKPFRVCGLRVGRDSLLVTRGLSEQVNPHISHCGSYTVSSCAPISVLYQMNLGLSAEF